MNNKKINKYKQLLKKEQSFKNYKHLCETLGEDIRNGKSKTYQTKEWQRHFSYVREGNKYIITDVYDESLEKIDLRTDRAVLIINSHPNLAAEWDYVRNTNYSITEVTSTSTDYYWWICKKCNLPIYNSPSNRIKTKKQITCANCNSSKQALIIYSLLMSSNLKVKTELTFDGLKGVNGKSLRFDYAILNDSDELLGLIEYDGEYHFEDTNTDYESYLATVHHDNLKNDYCKSHNIPLLRISCKEKNTYHDKLYNFLISVSAIKPNDTYIIELFDKNKRELNTDTLDKLLLKKEYHEKQLRAILNELEEFKDFVPSYPY